MLVLACSAPRADLKVGSDIAAELALAGGANFPGVSGGQRRRLSLALAIAKKPALLVADEPTTGLDAAAATAIMTLLGQLARDSQMAVVCTIHQPSASVYEGIDTLLLLTKGCTAYYGPSNGLVEYLGTVGKPVPVGSSLAEHALNLVNADFTSDAAVDEMIEAWRKRADGALHPGTHLAMGQHRSPILLPPEPTRASFLQQCTLLYSRHLLKLLVRDPALAMIVTILIIIEISWSAYAKPEA